MKYLCTRCKKEKDESEFHKGNGKKRPVDYNCKPCKRERLLKYYRDNPELFKERQKVQRIRHKEKRMGYAKKHRDEKKKYDTEYRKRNREEKIKKDREYNKNNRDVICKKKREKLQSNKENITDQYIIGHCLRQKDNDILKYKGMDGFDMLIELQRMKIKLHRYIKNNT